MAQGLLDRLDESIGMEEYDLGRDISDAAMQRGISPVEMRGQLIQTMLQDDGKTISDKDRDLYGMGEISLAEAVKRSTVDRTLGTDVKALSERVQKGIAGLRPKMEDFSEYMFGVPSYIDAEAGMGRTLSDLDQVQALAADSGRTISSRDFHKQIMDNLQGILNEAVPGKNISDRDRQFLQTLMGDIENKSRSTLPLGSYFTDQDRQRIEEIKGRILSNQDLAIGRTMSDQDFATQKRSQDFQQYLQGILNESGANISDRDRQIIQDFMGSNVDPNTLSDRDRQIIEELFKRKRSQGRTPSESNSDAAILEMLK